MKKKKIYIYTYVWRPIQASRANFRLNHGVKLFFFSNLSSTFENSNQIHFHFLVPSFICLSTFKKVPITMEFSRMPL